MGPFDIVVYGASGHTGRQIAADLAASGTAVAVAGRNREKLEAVAQGMPGGPVPVVVAGSDDVLALDALASRTRVVLSAAGPYAPHAEPLIAACVRHGTHYADLCAETVFIRHLIDRYHRQAADTGARIVPCCGFDSVPSDLGTLLLVEHIESLGRRCAGVKAFFRLLLALNGGSAATVLDMVRSDSLPHRQDPLLLNPDDRRGLEQADRQPDPVGPRYDDDLGAWVAPFFMSPVNTRVVRRSHALKEQWGSGYGSGFTYQEYLNPGGPLSLISASAISWGMLAAEAAAMVPGVTRWWQKLWPNPGDAPPRFFAKRGFFECRLVGTADDGSKFWLTLADHSDPSNEGTVKMAGEAALCLALEYGAGHGGGILTPATAIGSALAKRLQDRGVVIQLETRDSGDDRPGRTR